MCPALLLYIYSSLVDQEACMLRPECSHGAEILAAATRKPPYSVCGHEIAHLVKCGHSLVQEFADFYTKLQMMSENIRG